MKYLYHYTRASKLVGIINERMIKQATEYVDIRREKPVVWLSLNPHWEHSATPMLSNCTKLTFEEFSRIETPIRIAVDASKYLLGWMAFTRLSGCKPKIAKALIQTAKKSGADPSQWRVSFEPIPSDKWLEIQAYLEGQWRSLSPGIINEIAGVRLPNPVTSSCDRDKQQEQQTMKRLTNDPLNMELMQLLDRGEILIGRIQVDDGEDVGSYTALSACPSEHREGYRRALETRRNAYVRDVVYEPVFIATENATSVATLE